jgi:hypothetical protein
MTLRIKMKYYLAVAIGAALFASPTRARAVVLAHENFNSYNEGDPILNGAGGTGWTQPWIGGTAATPIRITTSGNIDASGGLELGTTGDNRSLAVRQFPVQTGVVYAGFKFKTGDWDGDFFQAYFNDVYSTMDTANPSFSGGLLNDPGQNRYFARKGSATAGIGTTNLSAFPHTPNTVHTFVLKLSKSLGGATDSYDESTIWIDQSTEAMPTAFVDAASIGFSTGTTPAIGATISTLHFRSNLEATDRVYVDNITIATTFAEALNGPPTAHPGDFDGDGDVDGADFVAWQTNFPKATGALPTEGDADGDGDVDGADFVVWQTNFPFPPGPGAAPVPEPTTFGTMAVLGSALAVSWATRRRQQPQVQ